jgi:hypothetical protein
MISLVSFGRGPSALSTCFILNAYGLTFEFLHLLVPVFIEFIELLQMSLLYLAFFALMLLAYLLFSLAL